MGKSRLAGFTSSTIVFLLFAGCSLDYSQARLPEDLSDKVPETMLLNFKQTTVNSNRIKRLIEADKAENFTKIKHTVFQKLRYTEFDEKGERIIQGVADKAIYETETENAEISGNIWFHSYTEKTSIYASSLSWKNKEKLLTAGPGELVRVVKEDGSFIKGTGFETDLRLKQIIFRYGVSGMYREEEEETGKPGEEESKDGSAQ